MIDADDPEGPRVNGKRVTEAEAKVARGLMGVVPQLDNLDIDVTVEDNLAKKMAQESISFAIKDAAP